MRRLPLKVVAEFLLRVAETDRPLEIGVVGPDRYEPDDAKRVGPLIAELAGDGVLVRSVAGNSCRASRHGGLVNYWRTDDPDRCRQRAAALRQRAAGLDDDGNRQNATLAVLRRNGASPASDRARLRVQLPSVTLARLPESSSKGIVMKLYSVRGWDSQFENSQSRKCKLLAWVPIPNKHDGKSYRRLIQMSNGPALYATWVLILEVASKCPARGILADEDGPLDADDLAAKTGCSVELFSEAFDVLTSPQIRWLEAEEVASTGSAVGACSQSAPSTLPLHPVETGLNRTEWKEQKGKEQKKDAADAAGVSPKPKRRKARKPEPVVIPKELDTSEARNALEEFREHRRQQRKPLTPIGEKKLLLEWASKGAARFVTAVDHSIANGWQGLFEPNQNGRASTGPDDPRGNFAAGRRYLENLGGDDDA